MVFTRLTTTRAPVVIVARRPYRFASNSIVCTMSGCCTRIWRRSARRVLSRPIDPIVWISKPCARSSGSTPSSPRLRSVMMLMSTPPSRSPGRRSASERSVPPSPSALTM